MGPTAGTITHVQAEHVATAVDALPEFGHRFFAKTGTDAYDEILLQNSLENSLFSPTLHGKTGQNMAIGVNQIVSFGQDSVGAKTSDNHSKTKVLTGKQGSVIVPNTNTQASVAQLDRASVFGTEGWGFESSQAYYITSLTQRSYSCLPSLSVT